MSDNRYFISVMTPAASAGSLTFQLDTFDAETNISITPTVSGITAGLSEISLALAIQNQLITQFSASGCLYTGTPAFSSEYYQATFQVTRTDHVVCIWSQAQFRLQETTNPTGSNIKLSDVPCLSTLAQAISINGGSFTTMSGSVYSTQQTIDLIEQTSATLCAYMRNNIVISTYLAQWSTNDTKGMFTSPTPGVEMDLPRVRRKNAPGVYPYYQYAIVTYSQQAYNWNRKTGKLTFRPSQLYVDIGEPFAEDNEVRLTFTAGYYTIPAVIQGTMVNMAVRGITRSSTGGAQELAGGSFRVKFWDFRDELNETLLPIKSFICKRMR